jgi:uncharacterized membrane protein
MVEQNVGPSRDAVIIPEHVGQNIQAIADLFANTERLVGRRQLANERMTDLFGRPATTYVLMLVVVAWIFANAIAPACGLRSLDPPPFFRLQGAAGI